MSKANRKLDRIERRYLLLQVFLATVVVGVLILTLYLMRQYSQQKTVAKLMPGVVLSHTYAPKRLGGFHSCQIRLDTGQLVQAECDGDSTVNKRVNIYETEVLGGGRRFVVATLPPR